MSGKRQKKEKPREVFERPAGSGIWWVNYYADGKQRREKAGRKSDAIKLYQLRKSQVATGVTIPTDLRAANRVASLPQSKFKVVKQSAVATLFVPSSFITP